MVAARENLQRERQFALKRAEDLLELNQARRSRWARWRRSRSRRPRQGVASQEEGVIIADGDPRERRGRAASADGGAPEDDPMWETSASFPPIAPVVRREGQIDLDAAIAMPLAQSVPRCSARRNRPCATTSCQRARRVSETCVKHGLDLSLIVVPSGDNFRVVHRLRRPGRFPTPDRHVRHRSRGPWATVSRDRSTATTSRGARSLTYTVSDRQQGGQGRTIAQAPRCRSREGRELDLR